MRVALIPTGRMEVEGLARFLQRRFSAHTFDTLTKRDATPHDGFTSRDVTPLLNEPDLSAANVAALAEELAAAVYPGRARPQQERWDGALVLDDLELVNQLHPERVTAVFHQAIQNHLKALPSHLAIHTQAALLQRASFHLAVPMTESWFFADPDALQRAGVPTSATPALQPQHDLEDFTTADPHYAAADIACCKAHLDLPAAKRKKHKVLWAQAGALRTRHPKAYLAWLCRDATEKSCSSYKESQGGAAALAHLRWERLTRQPPQHLGWLRALVNDLADLLKEPGLSWEGDESPHTSISQGDARSRVLRNL